MGLFACRGQKAMELQPYYTRGKRSNLGNTVYDPARPQGCARARGSLQLYRVTRGRHTAVGTGTQPPHLPIKPAAGTDQPAVPSILQRIQRTYSITALQGLDLPATKYHFSCIIDLLWVSRLLAGMCGVRLLCKPGAGSLGPAQGWEISAEMLRAAAGMIQRDLCQLLSQC